MGAITPTYDTNGNLTYDGTYTYAYDAENRLATITQGMTTIATYAYDAQGRRKSKTVSGTETTYVTDADNRGVLEYDGSTGAVQTWYAYGLGLDEPLNRVDVAGSSRQTLIPDAQGSILGALDSSGTLTETGYQTYGENPSLSSGSYQYTAQRFDPETTGSVYQPSGLYYFRARMYSPTWGRFFQPDPIGYAGGANLYAYVGNDPLNLIDPSGLKAEQIGNAVSGFLNTPLTNPQQDVQDIQKYMSDHPETLSNPSWQTFLAQSQQVQPLTIGQAAAAVTLVGGGITTAVGTGVAGLEAVGSVAAQIGAANRAEGIAADLESLGGGVPRLVPTTKGASQFIFPNGTVLRFDINPGQYLGTQGPHINLEVPGNSIPNIHIPLRP